MRNSGVITLVIVFIFALVGLLGFNIANYAGQPEKTAPGKVEKVKKRYDSGAKAQRWYMTVSVPEGKDTLKKRMRPDWAKQGAAVTVTYKVGRFQKAVAIKKVK